MKSLTRQHPFNDTLQENYMVLEENLRSTELEAIIKYDFNQPKQFIIYNEYEKNERNNQFRGNNQLMCTVDFLILMQSVSLGSYYTIDKSIKSDSRLGIPYLIDIMVSVMDTLTWYSLHYHVVNVGYRIQSSSFANPVLPDDTLLFNTPSWVKHQISVTKQKDAEDSTLSYFSQG